MSLLAAPHRRNILIFRCKARDPELRQAALDFPQDVIFAAEFLRLCPEPLAPLVARLVTRGHKSSKTLFRLLAPVVQDRLKVRNEEGDQVWNKPVGAQM